MNHKKSFLIVAVLLILLLGGASLLYSRLSGQMNMDQLSTLNPNETEDISRTDVQNETANDASTDTTATSKAETSEKSMAPDFTVYDIDGNAVSLSDFRGKPVVLNFWASWCGPCKSEMPDFETVYGEYGEEIHFLIVNMTDGSRETVETASAYAAESGYTFPVYYDTAFSAATAYSVYSIPTTYFIDREGYLVAQGRGALDLDTIQKGIAMILE